MLLVQPTGGLCNRLRAIDSAVSLARALQRKLIVIWYHDRDLATNFHHLFDPLTEVARIIDVRGFMMKRVIHFIIRFLSSPFVPGCFIGEDEACSVANSSSLFDCVKNERLVYIKSCHYYYPVDCPYAVFQPKKEIWREILCYRTDEFVGVHIRRTDNARSIQHSPVDGFIEAMQNELDRDSSSKFFLATDDPVMEKQLMKVFPGRIYVHEKASFQRSNPLAVRDALIDLFVLANCKKLIGSYWSSFTEAAWRIRDIEYLIVNQPTTEQVSIDAQ